MSKFFILYQPNAPRASWEIIEEHDNKQDAKTSLNGHRETYKNTAFVKMTCYPSAQLLNDWNEQHGYRYSAIHDGIKITVQYIDDIFKWNGYRHRYRVNMMNLETKARCSYFFHGSISDCSNGVYINNSFIKSIIETAKTDAQLTLDNYPTLHHFISGFGYDCESKDIYKLYKECVSLAHRLNRVFTSEWLEATT